MPDASIDFAGLTPSLTVDSALRRYDNSVIARCLNENVTKHNLLSHVDVSKMHGGTDMVKEVS